MKSIIGIDPGITGGIAVYGPDGYWSEQMPVMAVGAKGRRCVNPLGVKDLLETMGHSVVYLEKVHSMPKNGGAANFSFGDSFGCLRGVVMSMGYPLVLVTPQTWKKHFKLTKDKEMCRARAIELFPLDNFNLKKDIDRAEAMLIAFYGAQQ